MKHMRRVLFTTGLIALGLSLAGEAVAQGEAVKIYVERTYCTYLGTEVDISVLYGGDPVFEMGGFDLLLAYDHYALTLLGAAAGSFPDACAWEYFTYRYASQVPCGTGPCPQGVVRVVGIADTNNGSAYPGCFGRENEGELLSLSFRVTKDRTYECQYVPIRFIWYDCGDNVVGSRTGDTVFLSRHVYEYPIGTEGQPEIEDPDGEFPTHFGAPAECEPAVWPGSRTRVRYVDFYSGGVDIACAEPLDDRGDLNLDGRANSIADAVLYTNYFVYGTGVFTVNIQGQVAASDVNADGIALSVADLVYLIRLVEGDALPYPPLRPVTARVSVYGGTLSVNESMGAAYVVVEGNTNPTLLASWVDMKYAYDAAEGVTRVLVVGMVQGAAFEGDFLQVNGAVRDIEMATYEGAPVHLITSAMPISFVLLQNYPNPFNIETTISFALGREAEATVEIYNTAGQLVFRRVIQCVPGIYEVKWDGRTLNGNVASSGVYYYRVSTAEYSDSRKMVLLK